MELLRVEHLTIQLNREKRIVVNDVSLSLKAGEILGITGNSGSGKTMTMRGILHLLPKDARQISGKVIKQGQPGISMIFQDSKASLNPALRIGVQVEEALYAHRKKSRKERKLEVIRLLRMVELQNPEKCIHQYPHELSGGMRQRVAIAIALASNPDCLIADEPTISLDVTVQQQILKLIQRLSKERNMAVIFVSHDLAILKHFCQNIAIMQAGKVVEIESAKKIENRLRREYARTLVENQSPEMHGEAKANSTENYLEVHHLNYTIGKGKRRYSVLKDINLSVKRGEIYGLVGESGSGKTSLARKILETEDGMQMIFQDPYSSLNPRMCIGEALKEPLRAQGIKDRNRLQDKAESVLRKVGLEKTAMKKYPHEFSGGQKQRIAIAKALIMTPEFLICDEPVSSLDATIRKQIIDLLLDLKEEQNMTYLFIAHQLDLVEQLCDHISVMYGGRIVESGDTKQLYKTPLHPYTRDLLTAWQSGYSSEQNTNDPTEPQADNKKVQGCPYQNRCRQVQELCRKDMPETVTISGHSIACFLYKKQIGYKKESL